MELIRGHYNFPQSLSGCVSAIGKFDGIHLGHRAIINQVIQLAKQNSLISCILTFEPHPGEFFNPANIPARLSRLREKCEIFKELGIERLVVLNFNKQLAQLSAQDFIEKILIKNLNTKKIIIGPDFKFGKNRLGDVSLLSKNIETHSAKPIKKNDTQISSSIIREKLFHGELDVVETYLGEPYSMIGRVAHGRKQGRIIGFPTANIYLHRKTSPIQGVFAVKVLGLPEGDLCGVANVGTRPTIDGTRTILETHIFNFNREIYGEQVRVQFIKKLRDEKRYDNFELLKEQIFKDAEQARRMFNLASEIV